MPKGGKTDASDEDALEPKLKQLSLKELKRQLTLNKFEAAGTRGFSEFDASTSTRSEDKAGGRLKKLEEIIVIGITKAAYVREIKNGMDGMLIVSERLLVKRWICVVPVFSKS